MSKPIKQLHVFKMKCEFEILNQVHVKLSKQILERKAARLVTYEEIYAIEEKYDSH